ncbi:hypothetical protein MMC11_007831 [Xylographa trunciseda]|nr:hypothetical protein [Xylographa trunciseda]
MVAPTAEKRGNAIGNLLRRAINKSFFAAEELSNTGQGHLRNSNAVIFSLITCGQMSPLAAAANLPP